jgi:hypothetical protein
MISVIMSSEQQVPGNSETVEEAVVDHPEDRPVSWVSRHSRTLRDIGTVTVAVIIGVSIGLFFSKKK